ncbi:MAG: type I-A CRISPR-associated protein Cas5a [Candidatus Bathyarchaeia archaeon]
MLGIRVEGRFHWGFWVRIPNTSKVQSSLTIPPPTTLVGSLAYPLFKGIPELGEVRSKVKESKAHKKEEGILSSAYLLNEAVISCSIYLIDNAFPLEDVSKYNTLLFQRTMEGRRYSPQYRSGIIMSGKILYPDGRVVIAYLLNPEKLSALLKNGFKEKIENAAWQISRIGSKESIFSVDNVEIFDEVPPIKGTVKTRFYFPATAGEKIEEISFYYRENFWKGGWGNLDELEFVEYTIPGRRLPIESHSIRVDGVKEAYKFRDEEVIILA